MKPNLLLKITAILWLFASQLQAQSYIEKLKYDAYVQNDNNKWLRAIQYMEKTDLSDTENMEELIQCYNVYTSNLIKQDLDDQAEVALNKGETLVNQLLKKEPNNALALNNKGVFLGYEVALNKMKALTVGKKSEYYINEALRLEPNNPQILFDKGNALYYPPKMFGGNKQQALVYFQKAISIFENQNKTQYNWMYLQLLVLEGQCYTALGKYNSAKQSYLKVLKIAPDFLLVRDNLYPSLLEKMK